MQTKAPLHKEKYCSLLFTKNDYLGWIPNINSKILFSKTKITEYGFEDNFISNIVQREQNHKAIRKIVFSSHVNYLDRYHKGVNIRNGNFRFIFYGSINEEKIIENYYDEVLKGEPDRKEDFCGCTKDSLIGNLLIIQNRSKTYRPIEKKIIPILAKLHRYNIDWEEKNVDGTDFSELYQVGKQSIIEYNNLVNVINEETKKIKETKKNIEDHTGKITEEETFSIYKLNAYIDKSGLTFLHCDFNELHNDDLQLDGSSNFHEYTISNRFMEIAMNFIKQGFRQHHHHDEKQDSLMGISNLHKFRLSQNFEEILEHQINFLRKDIIDVKRNKKFNQCEPAGYIVYAKSFVEIFNFYELIDKKVYQHLTNTLNHQTENIKILKSIYKITIFSHHSVISLLTWLILFMYGTYNILSIIFPLNVQPQYIRVLFCIASFFIAYFLYFRHFYKNIKPFSILQANTNSIITLRWIKKYLKKKPTIHLNHL